MLCMYLPGPSAFIFSPLQVLSQLAEFWANPVGPMERNVTLPVFPSMYACDLISCVLILC